jgi:hypothetical protein
MFTLLWHRRPHALSALNRCIRMAVRFSASRAGRLLFFLMCQTLRHILKRNGDLTKQLLCRNQRNVETIPNGATRAYCVLSYRQCSKVDRRPR